MSTEFPYKEKFEHLTGLMARYRSVALAFSGGADSSFLLTAAKKAGVGRILAVTIVSQFFTQREKDRTIRIARDLGVDHIWPELDILAIPDVVKNGPDRCYHCKHHAFSAIRNAAWDLGIQRFIHGINTDDLGEHRPGIKAAKDLGFEAPLVTAGFSKAEVRACSRALGLETWDLPSQSCLATRIPTGEPITRQTLDLIEKAEAALHGLGLDLVRVRCHGRLARIETLSKDLERAVDPALRQQMVRALKQTGFSHVTLDLEGYGKGD